MSFGNARIFRCRTNRPISAGRPMNGERRIRIAMAPAICQPITGGSSGRCCCSRISPWRKWSTANCQARSHLLSDAGHMITDCGALGLAWFAFRLALNVEQGLRVIGGQRRDPRRFTRRRAPVGPARATGDKLGQRASRQQQQHYNHVPRLPPPWSYCALDGCRSIRSSRWWSPV